MSDIKYDKNSGCFYMIEDDKKIFFNYGTCPICDEMYISRLGVYYKYKELNEICRECEK